MAITQADVLDVAVLLDFYFAGVHQHGLQPGQFLHAVPDPLDGPHLPAPFAPKAFGHFDGSQRESTDARNAKARE